MNDRYRHLRGALIAVLAVFTGGCGIAVAAGWSVALNNSSSGSGKSADALGAPATVGASCTAPNTAKAVTVTWSAVSGATAYQVLDASTSNGTYTSWTTTASGTSYTTKSLSNGDYYFKVDAVRGGAWMGARSTATFVRTISGSSPYCR